MIIEQYNENWSQQFLEIKKILETKLSKIARIEHIGSTSIIGMWAKPIIDIDLVINDNNDFEITKNELEVLGYYHIGDLGITGREVFNRKNNGNDILDKINHHLYLCVKDNEELKRHILFRDYLNKNEVLKNVYIEIKKEIVKKYGDDREKYVLVKETEYKWFFNKVINEAREKLNYD